MTTKRRPQTATPAESATALLRDLAGSYTREPRNLRVNGVQRGSTIILSLQTDMDDHPRLVGSQGKHIWALQTIFALAGRKAGIAINLTLLEPWGGTKLPVQPFVEDPKWKPDATIALMRRVLDATMPCDYRLEHVAVGALSTLEVQPAQPDAATELLGKALHLLFHAAGKTQGRAIHVTMPEPAASGPAHT